jgi:hypothetical protein
MTYYYINDKGVMQKEVGIIPQSNTFVAVSPDGIMRKFTNGQLVASVPIDNSSLRNNIEWENASILLGSKVMRKRYKVKSKRKKCSCRK